MSNTFKDDPLQVTLRENAEKSEPEEITRESKPVKDKDLSCSFLREDQRDIDAYRDFLDSITDDYYYEVQEKFETVYSCKKNCPNKCQEHKDKVGVLSFSVYRQVKWLDPEYYRSLGKTNSHRKPVFIKHPTHLTKIHETESRTTVHNELHEVEKLVNPMKLENLEEVLED